MSAKKRYYKILIDGRSFNGGRLTWSLPRNGKPGEWHEVEGELKRCANGLHLTSEPTYRRVTSSVCYLAEHEGEVIGPFGDELVVRKCRLVRRVPWPELKTSDPEAPSEDKGDSPALVLLKHVWKSQGEGAGNSWRRLNSAMQVALRLAIESGFRFDPGDFSTFSAEFNAGYWWGDQEHYYSLACEGPHGPNPSAIKAIEAWKKRRPWIVMEDAGEPKVRPHVGSRFRWFDDPENPSPKGRHWAIVTSFNDKDDRLVACSYKDSDRSKIDRRFAIAREDVAAYHKAIARLKKKPERRDAC